MERIQSHTDWPSPRTDANICLVLDLLSPILGGLGLYLTSKAWQASPLILIALLLSEVSYIGIRNLTQPPNDP